MTPPRPTWTSSTGPVNLPTSRFISPIHCRPPCQPPDIAVHQPNPLLVDAADGFTVSATFGVNCSKNERFTTLWELEHVRGYLPARWELEDSSRMVVRQVSDVSELTEAPYSLRLGEYTVRITASYWSRYWDLDNFTTVHTTIGTTHTTTTGAAWTTSPQSTLPL